MNVSAGDRSGNNDNVAAIPGREHHLFGASPGDRVGEDDAPTTQRGVKRCADSRSFYGDSRGQCVPQS